MQKPNKRRNSFLLQAPGAEIEAPKQIWAKGTAINPDAIWPRMWSPAPREKAVMYIRGDVVEHLYAKLAEMDAALQAAIDMGYDDVGSP